MREEHRLSNYIRKILTALRIIVSFWDLRQVSKMIIFMDFLFAKEGSIQFAVIPFAEDILIAVN